MSVADGVGDLRGVQADHADPNLRVARAELGDQVGEEQVLRGAEGAERDGAAGKGADSAHGLCRLPRRRDSSLGARKEQLAASVRTRRRLVRTNRGTPSSFSRRSICSDRLGWAMYRASAAAEKQPCSTAARK
jgi:hypothetical protein